MGSQREGVKSSGWSALPAHSPNTAALSRTDFSLCLVNCHRLVPHLGSIFAPRVNYLCFSLKVALVPTWCQILLFKQMPGGKRDIRSND